MEDLQFMDEALALARQSAAEGEVPVGCVIVRDGKIVGRGRNCRETAKNALGHAEIQAISDACKNLAAKHSIPCIDLTAVTAAVYDWQLIAVAQVSCLIAPVSFRNPRVGIGHIRLSPVVGDCADKYRQHQNRTDAPGDKFLLFEFIGGGGPPLVGRHQDLGTLPNDRLGGADLGALAAAYTFMVGNVLYIHFTLGMTESAACAFIAVKLYSYNGNLIEQSVKRAERTEETAEKSEYEYTCKNEGDKKSEFPGKQRTETCKLALIYRV